MSAKRIRQKPISIALSSLLFVLVALTAVWALEAASFRWPVRKRRSSAESRTAASRAAPVKQQRESKTVRLNYYSTPWPKVLEKVAEATRSTLVMHETPPGRFSRRDRNRYSRTEVVRVLNRELEQRGFRLVEQGKYLVVLNLDTLRSRYRRPIAPRPLESSDKAKPIDAASSRPRQFSRSMETSAPRNRHPARHASGWPPALRPSVSYYEASPEQTLVSYEEPAEETQNPAGPIRQLGSAHAQPNAAVQRVVNAKNPGRIVRNLQPALDRLVAQTAPAAAQPDPQPADSTTDTNARRAGNGKNDTGEKKSTDEPASAKKPEATSPSLRIDGIKGPVTVQEIPGVGLVVTGNKEDVDAVIRIIEELDKIGKGTTPDIHLLLLRHVNSEALAELLSAVYEQLDTLRRRGTGQQRQTVSVLPVVKPNAVLVLAPGTEMQSILKLANELDQPVDPDSELRVFPLRNAIAAQLVEMIESFYEERGGLGTRVTAVADVRTNSVIVQARPRDLAEVAALIRKIDHGESKASHRIQFFELKNAVADELAEVINTALQSVLNPTGQPGQIGGQIAGTTAGGNQTSRQLREAKSVVLEFLTTNGKAGQVLRSGILADIRVTADPRRNELVVTAPAQSMELMAALIRQLDQPTSTVAEIKVFQLAEADATAMAELLAALFERQDEQNQLGIQVAGAGDASSGLIPLRFSVDIRTNSIVAIGGAEALAVVEAILLRLDESDVRERETTVVRLKNSPVVDVADAINQFLQSQRELAQLDPDLISNIELLEQEVIVVAEEVTNSLLISVTPRYAEQIRELIAKLDEAPAQVIIQALLVEVELDNTDEFGIELGFQDTLLFNRGITAAEDLLTISETNTSPNGVQTTTQNIISQAATPGFLFNNNPLGNNIRSQGRPGKVAGQGLSNFSLGRVNGDLGFGGLVLSASSESVSALIRALASRRNVHILSRPQIRTLDNQLAQIQVGQQVPIVDGVTVTSTGVASPNIVQDDAGIILTVTPRINPDGMIVMEVVAEKSQFGGQGVPIFTDASTGNVIESPIKDITTVVTTVSVPDGQTIVLGGMITKTDDTLERKVPWLGDIPVVGLAFRYDATMTRRTELLIFLTPRMIKSDSDSELIKQIEAERIHFFEQEAEEMHGPIFAVPPQIEGQDGFPPTLPAGGVYPAPPAPDDNDVPTTTLRGGEFLAPVINPPGTEQVSPLGWHQTDARELRPVPGADDVGADDSQTGRKPGLLRSFFRPFQTRSN